MKKDHYGKLLQNIIEVHQLKLGYICQRLEMSRYKLNQSLKTGIFKDYQKQWIDKLNQRLNGK